MITKQFRIYSPSTLSVQRCGKPPASRVVSAGTWAEADLDRSLDPPWRRSEANGCGFGLPGISGLAM
jgi:hypothetical protein